MRLLQLQNQGHAPVGHTPVQQRLTQLGPVRGLVFGQYAEASLDVHELIAAIAHGRAPAEWRRFGSRSIEEARAYFISSLRRRVGIFVAREFARFRLRRVPMLSLTRQQVDASLGRSRRDREAATNLRIQSAVPTDFFSYQAWVPLRA